MLSLIFRVIRNVQLVTLYLYKKSEYKGKQILCCFASGHTLSSKNNSKLHKMKIDKEICITKLAIFSSLFGEYLYQMSCSRLENFTVVSLLGCLSMCRKWNVHCAKYIFSVANLKNRSITIKSTAIVILIVRLLFFFIRLCNIK